ncbi:Zinc finger BED domain-containing protein 5 [Eumeta japonica]|uniref:Zinc finger BED domain-containing protein 5 n=1 Tax=Eumeta variegata TaxID=151549 RepID=A0A4C1V046_EUMVA|nr:Zinc finger BED domain-containing protein 5 [Eumeta japonica]
MRCEQLQRSVLVPTSWQPNFCSFPRFVRRRVRAIADTGGHGGDTRRTSGRARRAPRRGLGRSRLNLALTDKRLPTCLLCNKVLKNDSMKPSKLEDHLRRSDKIGKDIKYFQTLKEKYEKRPTVHSMFSSTSESNDEGLRASCNISFLIAKSGKPHNIGEQLILPAVEEVECLDEDIQTYVQQLIALHDDLKFRFEDILSMEIPPWIINLFDETEVDNVIVQEELLELSTLALMRS